MVIRNTFIEMSCCFLPEDSDTMTGALSGAFTAPQNKVNVKVVMLGKEYGGKTSLVERFLFGHFRPVNYKNTVAAEYRARRIEIDGRYVIIGVWDTAGSERYECLTRIYYRDAFAAVVCYDLTDPESFKKVKFWVEELLHNQPKCRIYFCGTKKDLLLEKFSTVKREVTQEEVLSFARSIHLRHKPKFYETSSKSGQNIDEIFQEIAREYLEDDDTIENDQAAENLQTINLEDSSKKTEKKCQSC